MNRERLRRHKRNRTELASVLLAIDKLQEHLGDVESEYIVAGRVTKSGRDFPYIERHMVVQMPDPKKTGPVWVRIRKKEQRKAELEKEIQEVEAFIDSLPEGMDRQIFEMVYLDGLSQQKVGEVLGYTQSMVSKIIKKYLKDS